MKRLFDIDDGMPLVEAAAAEDDAPPPRIDTERFRAYVKSPADIPEDTMYQLVDLVEGKYDINPEKPASTVSAPKTIDRLMNAQVIVYITENGIPVGMASIIDPTIENYQGIIPINIYSLYSGANLEGRVQQEFFCIADEYSDLGIAQEIKAQIQAMGAPTFTVIDSTDTKTEAGLMRNGYHFISEFKPSSNEVPVQLWTD